jgi:hypothetical protein
MYNLEPKKRTTLATSGVAMVVCILALYVGITTLSQNEILAQDKSTSITCTGAEDCEKTECVNGNCETTAANSSNISSTSGSDDKKVDEKKSDDRRSIADSLKERLSTRGD